MKNQHTRMLDHPIEDVRPWIERAWSGTDDDVFPRDRIATWRTNPPPHRADELVPGVTRVGHGPFTFVLREWTGTRWRVDVAHAEGWHGFDLEAVGGRTRITHTLEGKLGLGFRLLIVPLHDWAVESIFDRLEAALRTGVVPRETTRPMGRRASLVYAVMSRRPRSRRAREGRVQNSVGERDRRLDGGSIVR